MDKERVRYFQDDDNLSLKDLVRNEKMRTAEDQNKLFMRMASKVRPDVPECILKLKNVSLIFFKKTFNFLKKKSCVTYNSLRWLEAFMWIF